MKASKLLILCLTASQISAESIQPSEETQNILKNKKGFQTTIGLNIAKYQYKEPSVMSIKGNMIGMDYAGTFSFESGLYLKGDISLSYVKGKYTSNRTGSINNDPSWYTDIRPLVGRNFVFERNAIAPFTGLGYRVLRNDTSGKLSTTGHSGYNRVNRLLYIPVGLVHRLSLYGTACLETTVEYDGLIEGKQYGGVDGGVTNKQTKGYGLRLSSEYKTNRWSIGPYVKYWNIADSNLASGRTRTWIEPKNNTVEAGMRFSLIF